MNVFQLNRAYRAVGLRSPTSLCIWPLLIWGAVIGIATSIHFILGIILLLAGLPAINKVQSVVLLWNHQTAWLYGPPRLALVLGYVICLGIQAAVFGASLSCGHIMAASLGFSQFDFRSGKTALDVGFGAAWIFALVSYAVSCSGIASSRFVPIPLRAVLQGHNNRFRDSVVRILTMCLLIGVLIGSLSWASLGIGLVAGPLVMATVCSMLSVALLSSGENIPLAMTRETVTFARAPRTKPSGVRVLPHSGFNPVRALFWVQHRVTVIALALFIFGCFMHALLFPSLSYSAYLPVLIMAIAASTFPLGIDPLKYASLYCWGLDALHAMRLGYRFFIIGSIVAATLGFIIRLFLIDHPIPRELAVALTIWSAVVLLSCWRWFGALLGSLFLLLWIFDLWDIKFNMIDALGNFLIGLSPPVQLSASAALALAAACTLWAHSPGRRRRNNGSIRAG